MVTMGTAFGHDERLYTNILFFVLLGPYHGLGGGAARGAGDQVVRRGARSWGRTMLARQLTGYH
jgi:hypothetical protein